MNTIHKNLLEPLDGLKPHPENREIEDSRLETLRESLRANGMIEPIQYRKVGKGRQILHGHRRYRAAVLEGWTEAPMISLVVDDETALVMVLVSNIEREDLNALEQAEMMGALAKLKVTPERIAELTARNIKYVQSSLALAVAPAEIKSRVKAGKLPASIGVALAAVETRFMKDVVKAVVDRTDNFPGLLDQMYVDNHVIKPFLEDQSKKGAWVANKNACVKSWKDKLKAAGWDGVKLVHRGWDETLDHKFSWLSPWEGLHEEIEYVDSFHPIFTDKLVGDWATTRGVNFVLVPKPNYLRQKGDMSIDDTSMIRVCLDELVAIEKKQDSKSSWVEAWIDEEEDEEPDKTNDGLSWKERDALEREKRKVRKSEIDRVEAVVFEMLRTSEKKKLVEGIANGEAKKKVWLDSCENLVQSHAEKMFPDEKDEQDAEKKFKDWLNSPQLLNNISFTECLYRFLDLIDNMQYARDAGDLAELNSITKYLPDGPAKDALLALIDKLEKKEI